MADRTFQRAVKDRDNPYVMVNKSPVKDDGLSWKAKGILVYLLSLPDDWQIYESELVKHSTDGKASLNSGIKELIERGYIERIVRRNEQGHFKGYTYVVHEVLPETRFSEVGFSEIGLSENGKSDTTNNDSTNKDNTNNISNGIYLFWNNQNIIKHRKLTNKMRNKIKSTLKEYKEEEIKQSIKNYAEILNSKKYWFSYRWTIDEFLNRGLEKFMDGEVARQNYLDKAHKGQKQEGKSIYDNMEVYR
ncbi:hypothetical protein [Anaerosalibacter massiliensis]|uniref:hypothetical protein n=1 Tax=Anaerosalibacter massiliensis TaxID=1347392 RepID=UPI000679B61A|nr:hypothetical protein [Anaerosalibacter massiliensis]